VTGELSFLPIHAAGRYSGASLVCTADYVVSSYIPTLASLTKARYLWTPIACSQLAGLLICESSTDERSAAYLSDALGEVVAVRGCFASAGAHVLNEPAAHTSASELHALLEKTRAHILHMACHGIQHSDPLKSAFLLRDGTLSIEDIIQLKLPHALLAFLSACQTAKGDHNAPDQAVHLAASMLFCGFRSIVGTMWYVKHALLNLRSLMAFVYRSMCDKDGPKVARHFYSSLFKRGQVDLDDIAYALDEAIQALRRSNVPTSRWGCFMHIGG
jgi:CHAT domain-containing protein